MRELRPALRLSSCYVVTENALADETTQSQPRKHKPLATKTRKHETAGIENTHHNSPRQSTQSTQSITQKTFSNEDTKSTKILITTIKAGCKKGMT
jgi:hypothetical protein